jgi:glycosyltransferase involved in cell wall biosynthesis
MQPKRVLYIVSRFPWTSTTFTANEMAAVAAYGVEIFVAPVWKTPANHIPHEVEKPFLPNVVRPNWSSRRTWITMFKGLARKPSVLLTAARMLPGHLKSIYLPFKLLAAIPRGLYLGQWCVENQIEHIHAHFLTSPTTVALIASDVSGIPYSFTAHAFDITSTSPRLVNGSIPYKCRRAALGVTISQYNRQYMLEHWPELHDTRLEVIYNGIDLNLFKSNGRSTLLTNDTRRILCVSRLEPKKGHDILIRAVACLRERGRNVELDVIGDGDLCASLQALIEELGQGEFIRLPGSMTQEKLADEYRCADLFALASVPQANGNIDGLPPVLIESLAVELPTVSTQVTGIPEIVRDQDTGLCVPPNDVTALADALEWMLDHPDEAREMAQRGRTLVFEQFDRRRNAKQLLDRWREIHGN